MSPPLVFSILGRDRRCNVRLVAAADIEVVACNSCFGAGGFQAPFHPGVAHRLLLSASYHSDRVTREQPKALRVRAVSTKTRYILRQDGPGV